MIAAAGLALEPVVQIVLGVLGVIQTIALAIIADRSRRVRSSDEGRSRRAAPRERP